MRTLILVITITLLSLKPSTAGDTTIITAHDDVNMTWYGNYDAWAVFPDGSKTYRKVMMEYTMGCASTGCSGWDYDVEIYAMKPTGELDSNVAYFDTIRHAYDLLSGVDIVSCGSFYLVAPWTRNGDTLIDSGMSFAAVTELVDSLNKYDSYSTWSFDGTQFLNTTNDTSTFSTLSLYSTCDSDSSLFSLDYTFDTIWNVFEVLERFELGRAITPYGTYMRDGTNGYDNSWQHRFRFEVTDFVNLLKDSVLIRGKYSGWSSGFDITLKFYFIEGTPPRDVLNVQNVYSGGWSYPNGPDFDLNLPDKKVWIDTGVEHTKARVVITGHGFDNSTNCAEFCVRKYFLLNGATPIGENEIWNDDCGLNPIYPQGGTWIYDRAGWCPGTVAKLFEHDLTPFFTAGDSNDINMDMQNYSWSGTQAPSYKIETQVVSYGASNFDHDAELLDILAPSIHEDHLRKNPICDNPIVKIRNTGGETLGTVLIEYGVVGGTPCYYRWWSESDPLEHMGTAEVVLPPFDWTGFDGSNPVFYAKVSEPNLKPDEYADNDMLYSPFEMVPQLESMLVFWLKTNNVGSENGYELRDDNDSIIMRRESGTLANVTIYKDTFELDPGCYTLRVWDTDKDGLSFPWGTDGSGYARLKRITGSTLKNFPANFGTEIHYQFTVGYLQGADPNPMIDCSPRTDIRETLEKEEGFLIVPNPNQGVFTIKTLADDLSNSEMIITDLLGKEILRKTIKNDQIVLDLMDLSPSIYIVNMTIEGRKYSRSLVISR